MSETPSERNQRIFAEATGRGEPVFVIRAKDKIALSAIASYGTMADNVGVDKAFLDALNDLEGDFHAWRQAHRDEVKTPDVR